MIDARTKAWETWQEETHEGWDFQITFDAGWDAAMKEAKRVIDDEMMAEYEYNAIVMPAHDKIIKRLGLRK